MIAAFALVALPGALPVAVVAALDLPANRVLGAIGGWLAGSVVVLLALWAADAARLTGVKVYLLAWATGWVLACLVHLLAR